MQTENNTQNSSVVLLDPPPKPQLSRISQFQALIDQFIASQDIAKSSKETYRKALKQFVSWLDETCRLDHPSQLQREDILAYRDFLKAENRSSYTVSNYLTPVRKLFEWLESEKIYPNIARNVKGAKKARGFRKDCLTPEQIREALDSIDTSTQDGLRDYALFNLLVRTGLRTIEIIRATVGDVRQQSGEAVLWIQGKGRDDKDDFVLLLPDALRPINRYLASRGKLSANDPMFSSHSNRNNGTALTTRSIRRIIKNILRSIDIDSDRLSAHSLRHTAVTLSIKGGATLQQAQAMARHSDPKTTMVYFHNLDRINSGAERFIQF